MQKYCLTNCNHNLLHFFAVRVDGLWKIDQYLKDAKKEKHKDCLKFWQKVAETDKRLVEELKKMLVTKCKKGTFK